MKYKLTPTCTKQTQQSSQRSGKDSGSCPPLYLKRVSESDHTQMTGNLNVYYLVRDKPNFINNSNRSSLDFATYYLYHFWCKKNMTWIIYL